MSQVPAGWRLWEKYGPQLLAHRIGRDCPVCDSSERDHYFQTQDGYETVICRGCGMVYIPGVVPLELWNSVYFKIPDVARFMQSYIGGLNLGDEPLPANSERFQYYFNKVTSHVHPHTLSGVRYLDLGTYNGDAMVVARDHFGMQPFGVEGRTEIANAVAKHRGLCVLGGAAESVGASEIGGEVHVVTAFEVLEHAVNPRAVVRNMWQSLLPGGLAMVTVPNADNIEMQTLKEWCPHVSGGIVETGHVNWFDVNTLGRLFADGGMEVVDTFSQYASSLPNLINFLTGRKECLESYRNIASGCLEKSRFSPELDEAIARFSEYFGYWENAHRQGPILCLIARKPGTTQWGGPRGFTPSNPPGLRALGDGDFVWSAPGVDIRDGVLRYEGVPDGPYSYVVVSRDVVIDEAKLGEVFVMHARLYGGGLGVGLQRDKCWDMQQRIQGYGDFEVVLRPSSTGTYQLVVAHDVVQGGSYLPQRKNRTVKFEIRQIRLPRYR